MGNILPIPQNPTISATQEVRILILNEAYFYTACDFYKQQHCDGVY
jgi:hypothetical protein